MFHLIILLFIWSIGFGSSLSIYGTNSVKQILIDSQINNANTNLNQYVDQICDNINKKLTDTGHSRIKLPFVFEQVSNDLVYTQIFSPVIDLSLYNGSVSNLATFQRYGDANLKYINKTLILSTDLQLGSVTFEYDAKMKLSGFGPTKHISRTMEGFTASVALSVDAATLTINLKGLEISHAGSTSTANNDSDDFADQILYYVDSYLQNLTNKVLTNVLKNSIITKLGKINNL